MNQLDLNLLEQDTIRQIGELDQILILKQRGILRHPTDPILSALGSSIRGWKSALRSNLHLIEFIRLAKLRTQIGQLKTDSSGVTSPKDSPPTGGTNWYHPDDDCYST